MVIQKNISLKNLNTFGLEQKATSYSEIQIIDDLDKLYTEGYLAKKLLVIGGGSNILLTKDYDGLVLKNELKGIIILGEDDNSVTIEAGAGEVWHDFVLFCVKNNYGGVENMSLIPGSVGAAPMQNIGAYGAEIKSVFEKLNAFNLSTGKMESFSNAECKFGYRESIFKNTHKGKYIITSVVFKLNKNPNFNTSYGAIKGELERMGVKQLSIKAISDAVISIRKSKLPDPKEIGNSGSFFKNPVIPNSQFAKIKAKHPSIASYPDKEGHTKIAAGWLIEQAGWKGKTIDNYGVHKNQALVLVNYGGATGKQIFDLSQEIVDSVKTQFDIELHREVNII
jgi:UDP-N-acetylmuramate dehydrogenase